MSVELVTESTPEVVEAMGRLIPQLSRSAPPLDAAGARLKRPNHEAPPVGLGDEDDVGAG